jgi:hypothetical protein
MPYDIKSNVADCQGFAVVKRGTSKVVGCHKTAGDAQKQVAALYAAEPDMFAKSLDDKGLVKMHNELHGRDLDSSTVTLHHIIVDEMRQRGVSHPNVDCDLHKAVVLKSELVLPIEKAQAILKGDKPGHAFRGNQWTKGGAGGSAGGSAGGGESAEMAAAREEFQDVRNGVSEEAMGASAEVSSYRSNLTDDPTDADTLDEISVGFEDIGSTIAGAKFGSSDSQFEDAFQMLQGLDNLAGSIANRGARTLAQRYVQRVGEALDDFDSVR